MRRNALAATVCAAVTLATACTTTAGSQDTAPSTASTPASESVAAQPDQRDEFTVIATGDVLIHPALTEQAAADARETGEGAHDYRPLFAGVEPAISGADHAICHLEVPLAEEGGPYSGYPAFNAPPELADALRDTGYDVCTTASNHTLDQGEDGVRRTLDALDAAGVGHAGSARSEEEAKEPTITDVDGVKVGQVSFTFGFNGIPLPEDKPWMSNLLDADAVIDAADATRDAGADVVIASLHWGEEYAHEPTAEQRRIAEHLLGADSIDLIIGHHAHVVQPIEEINGKWVAYGLGNHVARHAEPRGVTEEGIAATFRFTKDGADWTVAEAGYIPTLVDLGPPIRLLDLSEGPADPRADEARARIEDIVLRDGAELSTPGE
jgi:hypothetical protein